MAWEASHYYLMAFKLLQQLAHTYSDRGPFNEPYASQVLANVSDIIAEFVHGDPAVSDDINTEYVLCNVNAISGTGGEGWQLKFPSGYSGRFGVGAAGQPVSNYTVIIPGSYSTVPWTGYAGDGGYIPKIMRDGVHIDVGHSSDWWLDCVSGILSCEDDLSLDSDDTVAVYVYTGVFLPRITVHASSIPGVNDDVTYGHSKLSFWLTESGTKLWLCTDPTNGAAVWKPVVCKPEDIPTGTFTNIITLDDGGTVKPNGVLGEIVCQTGTGVPGHSASEGTPYWATDTDKLYLNNNGSTGWTEIGAGGGASLPVVDTTEIVKGSGDSTKRMRFEVDTYVSPSATRVITMADSDLDLRPGSGTYASSGHTHAGVYAPASEGVTNGNAHDHSGGDGGSIPSSALTLSNGNRLLGREDAAGGACEELTVTNGLEFVSAGNSIGVANAGISDARLRDSAACSVIGRSAGTSGVPADITASANKQVLRRDSGVLGFGDCDPDSIGDLAEDTLLGRDSAGAGNCESISLGTGLEFTGAKVIQLSAKGRTRALIIYIENPVATDAFPIGYVGDAVTIIAVRAQTEGSSTTFRFNIEYRAKTTPFTTGTNIETSPTTYMTATDTGFEQTSGFENGSIAADKWLYFVAQSGGSGTPTKLIVCVEYTVD